MQTGATATIRALALAGQTGEAEAALTALVSRLFGLDVINLKINFDQYSLNSLNGFFDSGGEEFFFKFHQEEGEETMSGEYYRADILAQAGLPVDMPLYRSSLPGEQVLVYRRRYEPRFADILRRLDDEPDAPRRAAALAAEAKLSVTIFDVYRQSLHPITPAQSAAEPIHRLFHERLVDPETKKFPGGRLARFYVGQKFRFPGIELAWDEFKTLKFVINGTEYQDSVGSLFEAAHLRLAPSLLAGAGVVAHGDAHNANI
jgi:Ser/Thr protein kinase RdoA (MazF antagonist)